MRCIEPASYNFGYHRGIEDLLKQIGGSTFSEAIEIGNRANKLLEEIDKTTGTTEKRFLLTEKELKEVKSNAYMRGVSQSV